MILEGTVCRARIDGMLVKVAEKLFDNIWECHPKRGPARILHSDDLEPPANDQELKRWKAAYL